SLLWEALATGSVRLLARSLQRHFRIRPECAWVNFVRVHDDISWVFSDADARAVGLNGPAHRRFLNAFYSGQVAGSFARGVRFRKDAEREGTHISGTTASLAGLEKALEAGDEAEIDLAIRRILLLYSVVLSIGGIPLLYLGDEIGVLNDYSYLNDPHQAMDSRWLHRVRTDWEKVARRTQPGTIEGRIYIPLKHLIDLRQRLPALADLEMEVIETANPHVLGYLRQHGGQRMIVLANFSAQEQRVSAAQVQRDHLGATWTDLVTGEAVRLDRDVVLGPYRFVWLAPAV
ncbi:MAG: amylosucrase, partial [Chloroflexota bacterium]